MSQNICAGYSGHRLRGPIRYLVFAGLALFSMSVSAAYSYDPASLVFGNVVVGGTSSTRTVTFSNDNTYPSVDAIELNSISVSGPFNVTNNCPMLADDLVLNAQSSCTIDVTFSPQTYGNHNGTLTIIGIDQASGPFTQEIGLNGTGITPPRANLSFGSNGVDFGGVALNTPSSPVQVELSNTGTASATISAISASAPFTQTNDCPASLDVNQSCTVQVSVTPDTLGDVNGTLSVSGADYSGNLSDSIDLSATGQTVWLSVSDTTLSFSDTTVGDRSASQTVTFTNTGNQTLESLNFSIGGDFSETHDCSASLGAGASCSVTVTAEPTVAGDRSGTLQATAMGGTSQVSESVALSVRGIDPANGSDLVPSVTALDFPDATVDAESQPQILILSNPGSTAVTLNGITTEGDFTQTNNCGTSLAAGASCEIQITFLPKSEGTLSGTLNIDTTTGINRIPLSGTAAAVASDNPVADLLAPYTGGNPNLESLAGVIGEACPSGRLGDQLQADCDAVVGAAIDGDPNTARALQQVVPESATKANNVSRQGGETQVRNLGSRIAALRAGARGLSFNGLDWRIDGEDLPLHLLADAYRRSQGGGASGDNPLLESRLGVFVTGDIASGSKDETDLESGLDFDTYGLTVGADYRLDNQFILGGAFGVINTQADLNHNAGDLDTQGYSLSLYGTYYSEQNYFIDFSGSYGINNFEQTRNIVYQLNGGANVNQKLDADYDGDMVSLFIGSGYDFNRSAWSFGPRVDLEYVRSNVDGFTEQVSDASADGGGWATRVDSMDQTWLTLNLGGRVSYTHSTDWGVLIPYARLDWLHEFKDDSQSVNAYFVDDPSPQAIEISSEDPDRDYMRLRVGSSAQFQNGLVGFIDFGTLFANSRWSSSNVSLGVRMEF